MRQKIKIRRLSGNEHGLTLGQNENAGDKLDTLRNSREIRKHDEGVVKWMLVGVGAQELWLTVVSCTEHMVVGQEMIIPQLFGGQTDAAHGLRVALQLSLGVDNADLHGSLSHWFFSGAGPPLKLVSDFSNDVHQIENGCQSNDGLSDAPRH